MNISEEFIKHLSNLPGFDRSGFLDAHNQEALTSVRAHPKKFFPFDKLKPVPWHSEGFYLQKRPDFTLDPFFQSGNYYVQEASSMFLREVLNQLVLPDNPLILDLCASPGGKSTDVLSFLNGNGLLVSNEISPKRVSALVHNISKWSYPNSIVTHNSPQQITNSISEFDVILIDAPCSGSGMFRKIPEWANEWSLKLVNDCAERQKKILSEVIPQMKENSYLIYSTCSYSREENEAVIEFVCNEFNLESHEVILNNDWGINKSNIGTINAFRFWPQNLNGEGFFISVLNAKHQPEKVKRKTKNKFKYNQNKIVNEMLNFNSENSIFEDHEKVYFWNRYVHDFLQNNNELRYVKRGVLLGEFKGSDFIPAYDFAMSGLTSTEIQCLELSREDAVKYLRKENLVLNTDGMKKGFALVKHQNNSLGWAKILNGRINNYYPSEFRVLKMPDENGV